VTRRIPVLLAVVAALVAAALVERAHAPDGAASPPSVAAGLARTAPVVSGPDVLGSTWYCAAGSAGEIPAEDAPVEEPATESGTAGEGEAAEGEAAEGETTEDGAAEGEGDGPVVRGPIDADQTVVVANVSGEDRQATVTVHPGTGEPVVTTLDLPADTVERIVLADLVDAGAAATLVEADGGGIVVSHQVENDVGVDAGPCAATSSDVWHFAWGDTSRDAQTAVALFNPFPGDAVVDLTFVTSDGVREPQALTGLVVPGGSVVVADVDAEVQRRDHVTTTVRARSGRIVAERLQSFRPVDGEGRSGLTVDIGVPVPQEVWIHPYGRVEPGVAQRLVVFNPGDGPAEVDVELDLGDAVVGGVEPFELTVRAGDYEVIDLGAEPRIAEAIGDPEAAVEMGITVRSLNGAPVVSEVLTSSSGLAVSSGTAAVSTLQVLVDPALDPVEESRLRLVNLDATSEATVTVEVVRNGRQEVLEEITIDPAGRATVELDEVGPGPAAVVIRSSTPLVGELVTRWEEPSDLSTRSGIQGLDGLAPIPVLAG
jgi:hypothetical protein